MSQFIRRQSSRKRAVLVVDANPRTKMVTEEVLRELGATWIVEPDPVAALRHCQEHSPRLMVISASLAEPGAGFSLFRALLGSFSSGRLPRIPVVLLVTDEEASLYGSLLGSADAYVRSSRLDQPRARQAYRECLHHLVGPPPAELQPADPAELADLLLRHRDASESGVELLLRGEKGEATLVVYRGRLYAARCENRTGVDALVRAYSLLPGNRLTLHRRRLPVAPQAPPGVRVLALEAALLEAARLHDEAKR